MAKEDKTTTATANQPYRGHKIPSTVVIRRDIPPGTRLSGGRVSQKEPRAVPAR